MKEKLVVGIIADTTNPAAAERLLDDLHDLARLDPGFSSIEAIVLENPSGIDSHPISFRDASLVELHQVNRNTQLRDAARGFFGSLQIGTGRHPISIARTLLQRYAHARTLQKRACVWVLDEDLRLGPLLDGIRAGKPCLSEYVAVFRNERVDVAIGPVLGAPPLPARSTLRVNLEDVLRHLRVFRELGPRSSWPDRSFENAQVRARCPEYYYDFTTVHEDAGSLPYWMEPSYPGETVESAFARLVSAFPGLMDGVPMTRTIPIDGENVLPSLDLARGGNTLILEPRLLGRLPNVVPTFDGRACRRSDMVWSRLAVHLERARFARIPLPVWQDRTGAGRSSFGADKLVDDARGSALIRAFDALIAEGQLALGQRISEEVAWRAAHVFHAHLSARLDAIQRSERRARMLLGEIESYLSTMLEDDAFAAGAMLLQRCVADLRNALEPGCVPPCRVNDSLAVQRFFVGLHEALDEYRRAADLATQ